MDATNEENSKAKYANDSPEDKEHRFANAKMKSAKVGGEPRLLLYALTDIVTGTEIRYLILYSIQKYIYDLCIGDSRWQGF